MEGRKRRKKEENKMRGTMGAKDESPYLQLCVLFNNKQKKTNQKTVKKDLGYEIKWKKGNKNHVERRREWTEVSKEGLGTNAPQLHAKTSTCHFKAKTLPVSMPNFIFAACICNTWIKSRKERESREKHGGRGGRSEVEKWRWEGKKNGLMLFILAAC